jgi:hypothetical protein
VLAEVAQFAALPKDAFGTADRDLAAMTRDGVPFAPAFWVGHSLSPSPSRSSARALF